MKWKSQLSLITYDGLLNIYGIKYVYKQLYSINWTKKKNSLCKLTKYIPMSNQGNVYEIDVPLEEKKKR